MGFCFRCRPYLGPPDLTTSTASLAAAHACTSLPPHGTGNNVKTQFPCGPLTRPSRRLDRRIAIRAPYAAVAHTVSSIPDDKDDSELAKQRDRAVQPVKRVPNRAARSFLRGKAGNGKIGRAHA